MTFDGCTVAIHVGQGQVVEFDVALDDRGRAVVSSVLMHALVCECCQCEQSSVKTLG